MAARQVARALQPLSIAALAWLAAGCATPPQSRYAWGSYEDLIYVTELKPGTLPPEAQVEQLERDRQSARAKVQQLPPGWHAHLSYLYYQTGRLDLAREELLAEKSAFPESARFVDRLLANLGAGAEPRP